MEEERWHTVSFRVGEGEYGKLRKASGGLGISGYIREVLFGERNELDVIKRLGEKLGEMAERLGEIEGILVEELEKGGKEEEVESSNSCVGGALSGSGVKGVENNKRDNAAVIKRI